MVDDSCGSHAFVTYKQKECLPRGILLPNRVSPSV